MILLRVMVVLRPPLQPVSISFHLISNLETSAPIGAYGSVMSRKAYPKLSPLYISNIYFLWVFFLSLGMLISMYSIYLC